MKLRLDFLFTDSFFAGLCTQVFYSSNVDEKSNESNEKTAQRNSLKPKANWKVLLGLVINNITQLNSLFVFFPIHQ